MPQSQKAKLSQQVALKLEEKILNKEYLPEQAIPSEARLCEAFGVSRTVIREAIQQLKSQGVIYSIPGSGNYISKNDTSSLKRSMSLLANLNQDTPLNLEILQLRELLEIDCIKTVCQIDNTKLVTKLDRLVQSMKDNCSRPQEFSKIDHDFHLNIIKASGNTLFSTILESLYDSFVQISQQVYESKETLEELCLEHQAITQAIKDKNSQKASQLLHNHINKSKQDIS